MLGGRERKEGSDSGVGEASGVFMLLGVGGGSGGADLPRAGWSARVRVWVGWCVMHCTDAMQTSKHTRPNYHSHAQSHKSAQLHGADDDPGWLVSGFAARRVTHCKQGRAAQLRKLAGWLAGFRR